MGATRASRAVRFRATSNGCRDGCYTTSRPATRSRVPCPERDLMQTLAPEIFKAYDIRGVVGRTLTADAVRLIGQAVGSLAAEHGRNAIVVGRDGRLSGPELLDALSAGILASGVDVIDIRMVATPMTYFAA